MLQEPIFGRKIYWVAEGVIAVFVSSHVLHVEQQPLFPTTDTSIAANSQPSVATTSVVGHPIVVTQHQNLQNQLQHLNQTHQLLQP